MNEQPVVASAAATTLTRRRSLALLAGTAGAMALGACGAGSGQPTSLAYRPGADYAGARLSAIMRSAFIPLINELTDEQGQVWGETANASVDFAFLQDWRERYQETAALRRGEDVAELFGTAPHQLADRLVDVSPLVEELVLTAGGLVPAAHQAAYVDGVWRAVPWAYTAHALNYRPSMLEAAGVKVPTTYDELLDVAAALHENGLPMAGFTMSESGPNDSANLAYSMLWSFGGHEVDESGAKVTLDSAGTRAALEFFRELSQVTSAHSHDFDEGGNNDAFLAGEIAMTQNASSIFWKAQQEQPEIAADMGHSRYPIGPAGRHQLLEMNSLAVFEHCRNKDAALDLIRFLLHPEQLGQRSEISLAFFIPPMVDLLDDVDMPWNSPELSGMRGTGESGHLPGWPGPAGKEPDQAYQNRTIVKMFASVAQGHETTNSAVRIATGELRRVYET